ncbi:carboxypeptidase-like regulatory domain-containing protein [Carboxylicivirga taeanensis]|uniref:carboxypeptidase-like regulatory domain-containing protein n=1 Tax=Carboxylicivirga taeanensis TaxID=1416875 RepID=UPI003F6E34BA
MVIRYFFLFVAFSFIATSCEDANDEFALGVLEGVVIDAQTQTPIVNALISTNPASQSTMTDAEGRFVLEELEAGDYVVTAKRFGYDSGLENVKIRKDKISKVIVQLELSDEALGSVNISNPIPADNQEDIDVSCVFRWKSSIVDEDLVFQLTVYGSDSATPIFEVDQIADTFFVADELDYGKAHLWQVVAKKNEQLLGQSPVWSFMTSSMPAFPFIFVKGQSEKKIYAAPAKGEENHRLLKVTTLQNSFPRVNRHTDEILFSAVEDGSSKLFVLNEQGGDAKRVSSLEIGGNHSKGIGFCWSPTGEHVLFCHYDKLYRINKDGSGLFKVSTAPAGRNYVFVDWSGIADKIVVQTRGVNIYDSEIYLMNPDGTDMVPIVENEDGRTEYPTFSIDGKYVIFTHDHANVNDPYGRMYDSRIKVFELATSAVTDISYKEKADGTNDLQPRYSPDGSQIIFVNTPNTGTGQKNIYVMDVDGENRELYFENAEMPEWR